MEEKAKKKLFFFGCVGAAGKRCVCQAILSDQILLAATEGWAVQCQPSFCSRIRDYRDGQDRWGHAGGEDYIHGALKSSSVHKRLLPWPIRCSSALTCFTICMVFFCFFLYLLGAVNYCLLHYRLHVYVEHARPFSVSISCLCSMSGADCSPCGYRFFYQAARKRSVVKRQISCEGLLTNCYKQITSWQTPDCITASRFSCRTIVRLQAKSF